MVDDPAPNDRMTPISFWRSNTAIESVANKPIAPTAAITNEVMLKISPKLPIICKMSSSF